jgi:hypothetical protein
VGGLIGGEKTGCPGAEMRGGATWAVEGNCGLRNRGKDPTPGEACEDAEGGIDGPLYLPVCVGLFPDASDPTTGADDKKGLEVWKAVGVVDLKTEASCPDTGPDDEKGVALWEAAAKVGGEEAAKVGGEEEAGLWGKFPWLGFSVPIVFISYTWSPSNCYAYMNSPAALIWRYGGVPSQKIPMKNWEIGVTKDQAIGDTRQVDVVDAKYCDS